MARFLIERIGLQFHANASPDFEGVTQHQILCLSIYRRALPRWSDPGRTNFYSAIGAIDVHEAGAADDAAGFLRGGEDDGFAALLFRAGRCDEAIEVFASAHRVGNPAEDIVEMILRHIPELGGMMGANRLQPDGRAFEGYGEFNLQWGPRCTHLFVPGPQGIILHLAAISGITSRTRLCA